MARQRGGPGGPGTPAPDGPVRTCVGCRRRESDSRLTRIVVDRTGTALRVDPGRSAPGRGAWLHRDQRCIRTAIDRRALQRSLKVAHSVSTDAVGELLDEVGQEIQRNGPDTMSTP